MKELRVGKLEKILIVIAILAVLYMILTLFVFPLKARAGEFHGEFLFGYITQTDSSFQAELGIRYEFNLFKLAMSVGGAYVTQMDFAGDSGFYFRPYNEQYHFVTQIDFTNWLFFKYHHVCVHPVYSNAEQFEEHFEERGKKTVLSIGVKW
jgi:hypothetical protein